MALNLIVHSLSGIPAAKVEKLGPLFGGDKAGVDGVVDALAVDAVVSALAHGVVAGVDWGRYQS